MTLPPFPVDDSTLDLLWSAIHPDPDVAERSSVTDVCTMLSEMAGSDRSAVEESYGDTDIMRDPAYHPNDVIAALIEEVRRLRIGVQRRGWGGCDCWKGWSEFHDHPTLQCRREAIITTTGGSTLTGFVDVPVCRECGKLIEHGQ